MLEFFYLVTENISFSVYLKTVGLVAGIIISFVLFIAIILVIIQLLTKFLNDTRDKNARKNIIEKFNLTPNSFKEINITLNDNEEDRKFFIDMLKSLVNNSNDTSYFNLKFHAKINDKTFDIPIKEDALDVETLIKILQILGCKYYLHLDNNGNFFWYIKTSDDVVLHEDEITNYDFILMCLEPKE